VHLCWSLLLCECVCVGICWCVSEKCVLEFVGVSVLVCLCLLLCECVCVAVCCCVSVCMF